MEAGRPCPDAGNTPVLYQHIMNKNIKQPGFATRAIHAGQEPDRETGAVSAPIHATSTYVQQEIGKNKGYEYARVSNPTRTRLEQNLAALEGGIAARVFASGMAAINAICTMYKSGDHVVCGHNLYGGVPRLFNQVLAGYGIEFTYVNTSDARNVERAIRKKTRMVYVETPTNPLMALTDIAPSAKFATRRKWTWLSTTPSCRHISSSPSRWARTWWCTRPRNFSTATAMGWAASSSAPSPSKLKNSVSCRKPQERSFRHSSAGWCCGE